MCPSGPQSIVFSVQAHGLTPNTKIPDKVSRHFTLTKRDCSNFLTSVIKMLYRRSEIKFLQLTAKNMNLLTTLSNQA